MHSDGLRIREYQPEQHLVLDDEHGASSTDAALSVYTSASRRVMHDQCPRTGREGFLSNLNGNATIWFRGAKIEGLLD